jgi:hypothetical protein
MQFRAPSLPLTMLLAAALSACAPTAQQDAPAQGTAATPAVSAAAQTESEASTTVANNDEVICKKYDVTGSRIAKRKICMTRSEWEDYRRRSQEEFQRAEQRRGASQPGGESLGAR